MREKILLHICCAVCSAYPIQKLKEEGFEVIGYFYNPNIHPKEEYDHRLEHARIISSSLNFNLIERHYDVDEWMSKIRGYESERESGLRCGICFKIRLEETFNKANELGIPFFTSTLTVSPHKNSNMINEIGMLIGSNYKLLDDGEETAKIFTFPKRRLSEPRSDRGELRRKGKGTIFAVSKSPNKENFSDSKSNFLPYNFKKQDGFKKSKDFAKLNNIYCQNYCGCEFSAKKS